MKNLFALLFFILLFSSCTVQQPLYSWSKYEQASYNYLKNSDANSAQFLIETYQKIIDKQEGTRKIVPPGVYADYGFILLQSDKEEEGKTMLLKEVETYPESKVFITNVLKILEQ
ncbi:MAG TPA: DUF4810 domain-containing protein [Prolixibacteraceae bacterium]|nr:DUF4810 domain-containing protein [Prolixibacteraceae bacterium]HOS00759.1 DUF4810 domain-containing protein [Prolixibacteraceae bacterium]HOS90395.1 DUF4810 domain-containing protein [Prolixibacteraceae bacterium]HPL44912.1 DUF4810 domain-containing protein [Prolixibacteraceae bacterium]HQH76193.1 DUF4810 domain-containing protein [Prolixibacteraceae bacterium]